MDQETYGRKGIVGNSSQANEGTNENTLNTIGTASNPENVALENVIVLNSEDRVSDQAESGVLSTDTNGLVSSKSVENQAAIDSQGIGKSLNEGTSENSGNLVDRVVLDSEIVINSENRVCLSRGSEDSGARIDDFRLDDRVINLGQGNDQLDQGSNGDSSNSVNEVVLEMITVVNSEDEGVGGRGNGEFEVKGNESGSSRVIVDKSNITAPKEEKPSCMIGMKYAGSGGAGGGGLKDSWDGEKVCRICHLSSDGSMETISTTIPATATATSTATTITSMGLIQLGCGCKDELGIAHAHCAEAWFKLKGNRMCEICGETATNVTGVAVDGFMEEWNERRLIGGNGNSSGRSSGCWRGQPFCNFLMACLVIGFVLPWFFRVNMF